MVTLDGFSYTFNGHGEYTMLNIEETGFKFQARMHPLKTEGGDSRGTFLMAFVLQDDDSDMVQVSTRLWLCTGLIKFLPSTYTRKNAQVVTNLQQACSNAVPTTSQRDVFVLLVPSLLTTCYQVAELNRLVCTSCSNK